MDPAGGTNDVKVQNSTGSEVNKPVNKPAKNALSSDEKAVDSCGDSASKKPKGKKRKKRDETAPRQPLTGYVRYLNDRREQVRADNPGLSFPDLTKFMASEWSNLPPEQKKLYLDAAELDRDRYSQEMSAYKQTEAYKIFIEKQSEKKVSEEKPELQQEPERDPFFSSIEIPIFTEEFLDHNKSRETELRQLRKSNIDMEQQAAILKKHICDMRVAVEKMEAEAELARSNNAALTAHLDQLRESLVTSFQTVQLPGIKDPPTMATIDGVVLTLDGLLQDPANSKDPEFVSKVQLLSEHIKASHV